MSQQNKSALYQTLKKAGVEFSKEYRKYTEDELQEAYDLLRQRYEEAGEEPPALLGVEPEPEDNGIKLPPVKPRDPGEMAGMRQNTQAPDEPLRTDPETGYIWYQEEVQKKAYAAPRGRRVLKYTDPGTVERTVTNSAGETETFEIAGNESRISEVKITLPSYQVGIYKDPRHPFKIHTYGGQNGFDLFEVEEYYGGADQIPEDVKRIYVENVLCYDIRTVVRDIQAEYRRLQLAGRV